MARIVLTNNAKFRPYSFDEMLKPLAMATQEYNAIEEGIAELGSKADLMRIYANEEPNSKVANMYNTYANDLDKQAESLAKQGLSSVNRSDLLGLKRRYSSEITPIETAVTRRRQLAEEQRKAMAQDNSIMFDVDARTLSLDRLIESPELSYTPVSGKDIMTNVSKIAENLAKEARNNPNYFNKILGGDYYEYVKQHGFSSQSILDAINRSKNAPALLTAIVDNAVASSGVTKDWAGNAYDKAYEWANRGLWSAVGQTQTQLVDNWRAKLAAQKADSETSPSSKGFALNPSNIYSPKEQEEVDKNVAKYSQYFTKDNKGNTILTKEGMDELNKSKTSYSHSRGEDITTPSGFYSLMSSLGYTDNTSSANVAKLWDKYLSDNDFSKYDATKYTEYVYKLDPSKSSQDLYKGNIVTALGNKDKLYELDLDKKEGKFIETDDYITTKDLLSDRYRIVDRRPSELGSTVMILDTEKGKTKRYNMPRGVHQTAEDGRDAAIQSKLIAQRKLQNPNLSEEDRLKWKKAYDAFNQQQIMFEGQLDIINKTKDQNISPYWIP